VLAFERLEPQRRGLLKCADRLRADITDYLAQGSAVDLAGAPGRQFRSEVIGIWLLEAVNPARDPNT
jgi:hypothetical protein